MSGAHVPPEGTGRDEVANISDLGIELTREARGAQVWLPLAAYGPDAFTKHSTGAWTRLTGLRERSL